jgi:hypothetical protein
LRVSGGQSSHQIHLGYRFCFGRTLIGILGHRFMGSKESGPISS